MYLSVVVPLFNEEENVPLLNERLQRVLSVYGDDYEVLFVDDGSMDRTFEELRTVQAADPQEEAPPG